MKTYGELPIRKIKLEELPSFFRIGLEDPEKITYIYCGDVKYGDYGKKVYMQEVALSGHFCRCLGNVSDYNRTLNVERDDGNSWCKINIEPFEEIYKVKVVE